MSVSEIEMKYAPSSVYGSLAYDYRRLAAVPAFAPEFTPETDDGFAKQNEENKLPETSVRQKTHARTRKAAARGLRVSPLTIFGVMLAGIMLVLVLLSYVTLTKISDSSVALRREISTLEEEQTKLRVQYESVFDLNAIEEYAIGTLGMVKADSSQINYLDAVATDKAVIIKKESGVEGWLGEAKEFFSSIAESLS